MNAINHTIRKPITLTSVLVIMTVVLAACASAPAYTNTPSVTQPANTQSAASSSTITIDETTDPTLGNILVDQNGITLYIFTKDTPNTSNCDAACQAIWPPLVSQGTPKVGPGVDAALIGVATQANGEKIVTYDHQPLYYKATDKKAGDKTGEGFKNVWFAVSPSGQPVMGPTEAAPTAVPTTAPTIAPTTAPSSGYGAPAPVQITEPTIGVTSNYNLGQVLTSNGKTVYAYSEDAADTSNCNAVCQKVWAPVLTLGTPNVGTGVDSSLVGTAKLADGNLVVTYNHMPLYTFINDTASGDVSGQGFDNVWWALSPDGKTVGQPAEVSINIGNNPAIGSYLTGDRGEPLYIFTSDAPDTSNCTGACIAIWPAVITQGNPQLGSGVDASKIGTIKLANGQMMLTYNHMPLYYFVGDATPTDINGQGIKGVWYLLGADGNPITYTLPAPATTEPTINVVTNPTYGQILVDGNGMTLYVNVNDLKGESTCIQACFQNWDPLYTLGQPKIGTGVNASLVGTLTTSYGYMIVTYNNKPLYLAKTDMKPGDVTAEDANVSWYVISADGQPVVKR
jgi:predicted lipoprotein with Yx(FWY)xxD motif